MSEESDRARARGLTSHGWGHPLYRVEMTKILRLLDSLEGEEIEQFCSYEGECPTCFCPYYGILDEGRLTVSTGSDTTVSMSFPRERFLGAFLNAAWYRDSDGRSNLRWLPPHLTRGRDLVRDHGPYGIRQRIVRSGIYTREQLQGAGFTQHEYEVNDLAFRHLRPRRCDCDFGEYTDADLGPFFLPEESPLTTEVEQTFSGLGGSEPRPVRTGFRLRSKKARVRRRRRSRRKPYVASTATVDGVPSELTLSEPTTVGLAFLWKPSPRARKPRWYRENSRAKARKYFYSKCILVYPERKPRKHEAKYWYFQRKRGRYYLSVHHPI